MVKTIDPWDAVPEAVPARYTINEQTGQRGRQQKKIFGKEQRRQVKLQQRARHLSEDVFNRSLHYNKYDWKTRERIVMTPQLM
jgi:hypothetical protein